MDDIPSWTYHPAIADLAAEHVRASSAAG